MGVPSTPEPRQECGPADGGPHSGGREGSSARLILRSPASGGRDHAAPALRLPVRLLSIGILKVLVEFCMYGSLCRFSWSCRGRLVAAGCEA